MRPVSLPSSGPAATMNAENLATARAYLAGEGPFPQRAALNQLPGRFLTEFYATVARWVEWATTIVDTWPDDVNDAPYDLDAARESLALAETIQAIAAPGSTPGIAVDASRSG